MDDREALFLSSSLSEEHQELYKHDFHLSDRVSRTSKRTTSANQFKQKAQPGV